jgi:PAS domain S-box-containing protein
MENSNFKYDLFFELSLDLLCISGFDGYFKKVNPAVCHFLEYSAEELYSRPIYSFIHPEDQEITASVRNKLINSIPLFHFENRYLTKSGKTVWLSWTSKPVEEDQLIFAIAKDVTYKKVLEHERTNLLTQLTNLNEHLKKLTLKTSHDLRSPVNNLLSVFSLLKLPDIDARQNEKVIELIKTAGNNLKEMLNNSVDELSMNLDHLKPKESVYFEDTLAHTVDSIKHLIDSSDTKILSDFRGAEYAVFDKTYLESIFLNLLTNSIKYRNPNTSPAITISTQRTDTNSIKLTFEDNGMGFDVNSEGPDLFKLTSNKNNGESTPESKGVGLYLVYSHVTHHGGTIDVHSEPGVGTRFTIILP